MSSTDLKKEIQEYWYILKWSPTSFISGHEGKNALLFRDIAKPGLMQDITHLVGSALISTIKLTNMLAKKTLNRKMKRNASEAPFLLLITFGTPKYAGEEEEIIRACMRSGINIIIFYVVKNVIMENGASSPVHLLPNLSCYIKTLFFGLKEITVGMRYFFSSNPKKRRLFASIAGSIHPYLFNKIVAKSIINIFGKPKAVLSLCPFAPASIAMIESFKESMILTLGIRTQSTSYAMEHLVINSDILFAKSEYEKKNI
jgi:hypothetical protein